jgi:uncharacterized membrane protein YfcA
MTEYLVLAAAAFFAGVLNTVAGGGTFLTFPALVYTGVPVVVADATSARSRSYRISWRGRRLPGELAAIDRSRLLRIAGVTTVSGLVGSILLLVSSNEAFSRQSSLSCWLGGPHERTEEWAVVRPFGHLRGGHCGGGYRGLAPRGLLMMAAATAGGYAGAPLARALPRLES